MIYLMCGLIVAIIKTVEGKTPRWGKNCFIAENAVLTGDCILGDDCSIWYSAVLRSDVDAIRCGNRVNVQDCACIHQTLSTVRMILRDGLAVSVGTKAVFNEKLGKELAARFTKGKIIEMIELTDSSAIKIKQNININLLTTWLCGEYRRISWQR